MDILNKKERTKSFLLFLLMLLITFGTIFMGLFFNVRMPWKENKALREENKHIRFEMKYQKKFYDKLKNIDKEIDSLSKVDEGYFYVEKTVVLDIVNLKNNIPKDSLQNYEFYENIILNYKKLIDVKGALKKNEVSGADVSEFNEKISDLEGQVSDLERSLQLCRRLNNN